MLNFRNFIILTLLICSTSVFAQTLATPSESEKGNSISENWVHIAEQEHGQGRTYRRYAINEDSLANVMLFYCPQKASINPNILFSLEKYGKLETFFPNGLEKFVGNFIINNNKQISLFGKYENDNDLIFSRTTESQQDVDTLLKANQFKLSIAADSNRQASIRFYTDDRLTSALPRFLEILNIKAPKFYTTDAMLADCATFREGISTSEIEGSPKSLPENTKLLVRAGVDDGFTIGKLRACVKFQQSKLKYATPYRELHSLGDDSLTIVFGLKSEFTLRATKLRLPNDEMVVSVYQAEFRDVEINDNRELLALIAIICS